MIYFPRYNLRLDPATAGRTLTAVKLLREEGIRLTPDDLQLYAEAFHGLKDVHWELAARMLNETDEYLIAGGDITTLVGRYREALTRYCGGNEDVVQETLMQLGDFPCDGRLLRPWLFNRACLALEAERKRQRREARRLAKYAAAV